MSNFFSKIELKPVIAAISDLSQLDHSLESPCENIFLLTGNIFNLKEIANKVKSKNKELYIHIDLIDGFSKDTWGLEYIIKNIKPDGIITTKNNLIKLGKDLGAFTIQRLSILDSLSLDEGIKSIKNTRPDVVEILPGIIPKVIKKIHLETNIPIIAGGLVIDEEDLVDCLNSGAVAVSTTNKGLWYL